MPVVGPRRLSRALAAAATAVLALGTVPLAAPATAATGAATTTTAELAPDDAPLAVTIRSMTPGALPARGNIVITGTVTNRTDETWRSIALYAIGPDVDDAGTVLFPPMRNQGELELAMQTPYDDVVGNRITTAGTFGEVEELAPGATTGYRISVPTSAIEVTRAGVYWFGVHALGESDSVPKDLNADGRARTFLPYVPHRYDADPLDEALVVPLAQPVHYAADGTVDDVDGWVQALAPGGRLSRLLDFVDAGDPTTTDVTWVVDPAMVDAIAQLAAGNPARTLGPAPGEDDPSATPTEEPVEDAEPLPEFAQVAAGWLVRLQDSVAGHDVLTLPYGNVDVPATLRHAPALLDLALAQRSAALDDLGIDTEPVLLSPSGYLDPASVRAADPDTRILVTDRMYGAKPPAAVEAEGHRLLLTSYGATQGTPGPGASLTGIGIRQRLLAEAAVRAVKNQGQPVVAVLPLEWSLDGASSFWSGLDVPWLDLAGLDEADAAATAEVVSPDDLDYPRQQRRRELRAPAVQGVADLIKAGDTLQNILTDDTSIGGTITEEALTGLSYFVRYTRTSGRFFTNRSRSWVDQRLTGVRISASQGVTLSGANGVFVVNLTNTLDQRVTVSLRAESDAGIEVIAPEEIVLRPGGRDSIQLEARTTTNSVHNVTLLVTDGTGEPLGSSDSLPIRPTQVSGVIWLIMGTGAGLLFLAIAVRLVRRVHRARQGDPTAGRRGTRDRAAAAAEAEQASTTSTTGTSPAEAV